MTLESFLAWKLKFDKELALKKLREEDEKMKNLTPKEREEWKRAGTRLTGGSSQFSSILIDANFEYPGRQLFERNRNLEEDNLMEEGTVSVDFSQYERTQAEEEDEDDRVRFSDSD